MSRGTLPVCLAVALACGTAPPARTPQPRPGLAASLVTLGLYVPQNVTWWCNAEEAECTEDDEREECQVYVREDD